MAARSPKKRPNRARAGVLALLVLGLLALPASAQADPVRSQGCTLTLERTGNNTARFSFACNRRIFQVIGRTSKRARVTGGPPGVFRTGGTPSYFCPDFTSGPGDPSDLFFPDSFICAPLAGVGLRRAEATLQAADVCGREPLRLRRVGLLSVLPVLAIININRDVVIQGCPADRPARRRRPPEPPQERCTITGSRANNVIRGTSGDDVICAGAGNDLVYGRAGDDIVRGEAGNDELRGESGRDELNGGPGRDQCHTDAQDIQHDC